MNIEVALKMLEDALAENRRLRETVVFLEKKMERKKPRLKKGTVEARKAMMSSRWERGGTFFTRSKEFNAMSHDEVHAYYREFPDTEWCEKAYAAGIVNLSGQPGIDRTSIKKK